MMSNYYAALCFKASLIFSEALDEVSSLSMFK
jgi:hypothetical protein